MQQDDSVINRWAETPLVHIITSLKVTGQPQL